MKTTQYTEEELEIVDYIENSNPQSIPNLKEEMELITNIVSENVQKKKQVNFRLLESDLEKLKTKALIEGIPYQTLLSSIVHKFVNGTMISKT
ncbi:MAG TPA: antitoxin [Campylobacterales bacterium]|nr:antitoxin [Campylobacterales bacterium]